MIKENLKKQLTDRLKNKKSALLVIDVQNDFCHNDGSFAKRKVDLSHVQKVVPKISSFIESCRRLSLPIIFIKTIHSDWSNSQSWLGRMGGMAIKFPVCLPDSWGSEFYELKPKEDEYIVTKHRYSAFVGTDLNIILRSKGIETLLLTGVVTNICVETTARDGFNLDYNIILIEDCCGSYVMEEHQSTLNNIAKYFGIVADSKSIIKILMDIKK